MTTAMKRWKEAVEAHQEQSIKIQMESAWPQSDISGNLSTGCKDDPRRTGDPVLDRLNLEVGTRTSVLDVGGWSRRICPLRSRCVTVVEASTVMGEALAENSKKARIENISVVNGLWEDVEVDPAQVVLCANVVFDVADLEPFILKLESHAKDRVLISRQWSRPTRCSRPCGKRYTRKRGKTCPASQSS